MVRTRSLLLLLIGCASFHLHASAQHKDASSPFAALDEETREEVRWYAECRSLATLFNIERDRLGERFDAELLKFVGKSDVRHFWCARFLVDPDYLDGRKPRPYLNLLLLQQGLLLTQSKKSDFGPEYRWIEEVSYRFFLAVGYQRAGLKALAARHKQWLESRRKEDPTIRGEMRGSDDDWKVYETIPLPHPDAKAPE